MAALRWILLLGGVAFLCGLLWWESRRSARGQSSDGGHGGQRDGAPPAARSAEPSPLLYAQERPLAVNLPTIEMDAPGAISRVARRAEPLMGDAIEFSDAFEPIAAARGAATPAAAAAEPALVAESLTAAIRPMLSDAETPPPSTLIVEWPPEDERRILSLRIVPERAQRFAGRALRQALAACGFLHGRFGIYHQPDENGRALLSAASLSRPGVLDPDNMDFQQFVGLNLFAVLPGALSPQLTLERLIAVAEDLAARCGGVVQDERGVLLDAAVEATLRHDLGAAPPGLSAEPAA